MSISQLAETNAVLYIYIVSLHRATGMGDDIMHKSCWWRTFDAVVPNCKCSQLHGVKFTSSPGNRNWTGCGNLARAKNRKRGFSAYPSIRKQLVKHSTPILNSNSISRVLGSCRDCSQNGKGHNNLPIFHPHFLPAFSAPRSSYFVHWFSLSSHQQPIKLKKYLYMIIISRRPTRAVEKLRLETVVNNIDDKWRATWIVEDKDRRTDAHANSIQIHIERSAWESELHQGAWMYITLSCSFSLM